MNTIGVIAPYKYEGMWVFDDPAVGLVREPFVTSAMASPVRETCCRRNRIEPAKVRELTGRNSAQPGTVTFLLYPHDCFNRCHGAFREAALFRQVATADPAKLVALGINDRPA